MKIYRRLLKYTGNYSKYILPFFVFTLFSVFFGVFQYALIIPLLIFYLILQIRLMQQNIQIYLNFNFPSVSSKITFTTW